MYFRKDLSNAFVPASIRSSLSVSEWLSGGCKIDEAPAYRLPVSLIDCNYSEITANQIKLLHLIYALAVESKSPVIEVTKSHAATYMSNRTNNIRYVFSGYKGLTVRFPVIGIDLNQKEETSLSVFVNIEEFHLSYRITLTDEFFAHLVGGRLYTFIRLSNIRYLSKKGSLLLKPVFAYYASVIKEEGFWKTLNIDHLKKIMNMKKSISTARFRGKELPEALEELNGLYGMPFTSDYAFDREKNEYTMSFRKISKDAGVKIEGFNARLFALKDIEEFYLKPIEWGRVISDCGYTFYGNDRDVSFARKVVLSYLVHVNTCEELESPKDMLYKVVSDGLAQMSWKSEKVSKRILVEAIEAYEYRAGMQINKLLKVRSGERLTIVKPSFASPVITPSPVSAPEPVAAPAADPVVEEVAQVEEVVEIVTSEPVSHYMFEEEEEGEVVDVPDFLWTAESAFAASVLGLEDKKAVVVSEDDDILSLIDADLLDEIMSPVQSDEVVNLPETKQDDLSDLDREIDELFGSIEASEPAKVAAMGDTARYETVTEQGRASGYLRDSGNLFNKLNMTTLLLNGKTILDVIEEQPELVHYSVFGDSVNSRVVTRDGEQVVLKSDNDRTKLAPAFKLPKLSGSHVQIKSLACLASK